MPESPSEAEILQLAMQRLREKNEAYFKRSQPSIYKMVEGRKLENSDLQIVPAPNDELELDVIEKGANRYFNRGKYYSEEEAKKFITQMTPGNTLPPSAPVGPDLFTFQRVGSLHFKQLANDLNNRITMDPSITIPDFIPLVVIMGIGLGLHIEKIIKQKEINSIIIYENNLDRFLTSLYTIDWEEVFYRFNQEPGKTIQLILSTGDNAHVHHACLWNEIVCYCPYFPFVTMFYNHLNDSVNKKIIEQIQKDIVVYLQQWGNYDDEINQYNNARHNLLLGSRIYLPSRFKVNPDMPIAVIGAGPSLDERIKYLKKYRDKMLVISCGTTIGTLFKHGVKPDFHVELESDYIVYEAISKATTEEYRKGITLLASVQVNPRCLALFEQSLVYFKDSTALADLYISNPKDIVNNTTPTCTNAGIAVAYQMRPKNLFLFGTDFGFIDKDKHHASGSVYYQDKDEISFVLANANDFEKEPLAKTTSVHGTQIETKPMYYTAQRRVEECIKNCHLDKIKVYNCADGASIKNSVWLPNEQLDDLLNNLNIKTSPQTVAEEIFNLSHPTNIDEINLQSNKLIQCVTDMFDSLLAIKLPSSNLQDIAKHSYTLNNIVSREFRDKYGYIYYFLRGQIWIYLTLMFVYALHAKSDEDREYLASLCTKWLEDHKEKILQEMHEILFHEKSIEDDIWINRTVEEPVE